LADPQDTKRGLFTPEVKKAIGHIVALTVANVCVAIANQTGEANEEYIINRVSHPPVESTPIPEVPLEHEHSK